MLRISLISVICGFDNVLATFDQHDTLANIDGHVQY